MAKRRHRNAKLAGGSSTTLKGRLNTESELDPGHSRTGWHSLRVATPVIVVIACLVAMESFIAPIDSSPATIKVHDHQPTPASTIRSIFAGPGYKDKNGALPFKLKINQLLEHLREYERLRSGEQSPRTTVRLSRLSHMIFRSVLRLLPSHFASQEHKSLVLAGCEILQSGVRPLKGPHLFYGALCDEQEAIFQTQNRLNGTWPLTPGQPSCEAGLATNHP